ncbi:MAG: CpaF family protein [Mariniblastus sp.]
MSVIGSTIDQNGLWFGSSISQPTAVVSDEIQFQSLKAKIHESLVSSLDLVSAKGLSDEKLRTQLRPFIEEEIALSDSKYLKTLSNEMRARLASELHEEMFGLGPLEKLMRDPTVSDILVNHCHEVFVERNGMLELSEVVFADNTHLMRIIQRIVSAVGRRVDEVCPMVDARLPDGSRVNAVIPPLAIDGPKLSIRRFGKFHLGLESIVNYQTMTTAMSEFLAAAVRAKVSIVVSGGTGAGKTTLLNALSSKINEGERVVTIEDSAELLLQHRHVARLETRPANSEGVGELTQRDLLRNSLRMRPDRIIVGEVRGPEALDMLQAMNTGHEGSMSTIHANDTIDAINRLELMIAMSKLELPIEVVRSYIAAGINLLVHVARLKGGVRRVTRISELQKSTDGGYTLNDIFRFKRTGTDESGKAKGVFETTGYRPNCLDRFFEEGVDFCESLLEEQTVDFSLENGVEE